MQKATFEVTVDHHLLEFGFDQEHIQRHINEWLVLSLFTEGHISSGKAAKLLGITRIDFLALLRKHNIAYVDYTAKELQEEFQRIQYQPARY